MLEPSLAHESIRRKVEMNIVDFWLFVNSQLELIKMDANIDIGRAIARTSSLLLDGSDYYR